MYNVLQDGIHIAYFARLTLHMHHRHSLSIMSCSMGSTSRNLSGTHCTYVPPSFLMYNVLQDGIHIAYFARYTLHMHHHLVSCIQRSVFVVLCAGWHPHRVLCAVHAAHAPPPGVPNPDAARCEAAGSGAKHRWARHRPADYRYATHASHLCGVPIVHLTSPRWLEQM
jgi:hypothetical protein